MNLINQIAQKFDNEKTFTFSKLDPFSEESSWISTGSPSLDYNLNTLGYPTGIIEIRGKSQSGKTTFSLQAIKSAQQQYGDKAIICILSSERRDNKPYAKELGINIENVLIHRVVTIEDVFNKVHQTISNAQNAIYENFREEVKSEGEVRVSDKSKFEAAVAEKVRNFGKLRYLFIWDSLGNTIAAQEKEKMEKRAKEDDASHAAMAAAARAINIGFRSIVGLNDEDTITFMFINRSYANMQGRPGKTSYGGEAVELFPCMRLDLSRKQGIKIGDTEVGQITEVKVIKSDFQPPKQKFDVEIKYGTGFVLNSQDIEMAIKFKLLEKFGIGGAKDKKVSWKSRKELYELYDEGNTFLKILTNKMIKRFNKATLEERAEKLEE